MRILTIRLKNLNSLAHEWSIDLTHPNYLDEGIFAITGPTGSGKSTLLDAICLALYGQTPRLDKVTKSSNEIMSRQTGECFAEVTFATQKGRFVAHWSQRRARNKPDGELQEAKHELSDIDTGKILTSKLRDTLKKVEAVTGMDFERFTRSMLLAQGSFAAFLKASADERSPILEQITGTQIYSDISKAVHERNSKEQAQLAVLTASLAGIALLTEAEVEQLTQQQNHNDERLIAQAQKIASLQAQVKWCEEMDKTQISLVELTQRKPLLEQEIVTFLPDKKRLEQHHLSQMLVPLDTQLQDLTTDINQLDTQYQQYLAQGPEKKEKLANTLILLKEKQEILKQSKIVQAQELPLIQQAQALHIRLEEMEKHLKTSHQQQRREEKQCQTLDLAITHTESELHHLNELLTQAQANSVSIETKAHLVQQLDSLTHQVTQLNRVKDSLYQTKDTQAQREACQTALESLSQQIQTQQRIQEQHQPLLQQLEQQLEAQQHLWQQANKALALTDHRQQLLEGEACPLCGSTHHPYRENEGKSSPHLPLLAEITSLRDNTKTRFIKTQQEDQALSLLLTKLTTQQEAQQQQLESLIQQLAIQVQQRQAVICHLGEEALSMMLRDNPPIPQQLNALELLMTRLQQQISAIKQQQEQLESIAHWQQQREKHLIVLEKDRQQRDLCVVNLAKYSQALTEQKAAVAEVQQRYHSLTQGRALTQWQTQLETQQQHAEQALETVQTQLHTDQALLTQIEQRLVSDEARLAQLSQRKQALADELIAGIRSLGYDDESAYRASLLTPSVVAQWEATAQALADQQRLQDSQYQQLQTRLTELIAHPLTSDSLEKVLQQLQIEEAQRQILQQEQGSLAHQLRVHQQAVSVHQQQLQQREAQQQECQRWKALHELIGSADGKKFRNFAQGLTFERMVEHANRQLTKMNDRYLLIRDAQVPLELKVMDNYQAGEIRSTKNLSGGESFIISLALSLGLSQMVSQYLRVDSLFLDEGFGTLDEEALDTALDTLANLQHEGKVIGVISHVSQLKERIRMQIQVTPTNRGRSLLEGVGIKQIN